MADPELVSRAQGGDGRAFEEIYRQYVGRVYALCLRLTADVVQAETLTQDVFVRVWQKLATYQGRGSFGGWLRRVTVNVVVEDRRAMARQRPRAAARLRLRRWEKDLRAGRQPAVQRRLPERLEGRPSLRAAVNRRGPRLPRRRLQP